MSLLEKIDFSNIALFKGLGSIDLAKLIPSLEPMHYRAGDVVFRTGDAGDSMLIIISGKASTYLESSGNVTELAVLGPGDVVGEMSLITGKTRSACVKAVEDMEVLCLRKNRFDKLVKQHKSFSLHLCSLMASKIFDANAAELGADDAVSQRAKADVSVDTQAVKVRKKPSGSIRKTVGWFLCLLVPAAIILFVPENGMKEGSVYFLATFAAMTLMWVFGLVDEYIPGLFALMVPLAMGLVPPPVVLSGFASDGFVLAMSFLGLGAVLLASGLSYRILLLLLRYLPDSGFWHNACLLGIGTFLTPLIPSANGRIALLGPFAADLADILKLKPDSPGATRLAISSFTGASLFSAVFLSSKSVNFVVLGLLPTQLQDQFHWLNWFLAASFTGLVMLVMYGVGMALAFRNCGQARISRVAISAQLAIMGRMSAAEWAAIISILVFIFGIVTASMHRIQTPCIGLAIICALLFLGALDKKDFQTKIDWAFLLYLSEMVGIVAVFDHLGLDKWMAQQLGRIGIDAFLGGNPYLFVAIMAAFIFIIRLAVPISATIVILAALLMPLADLRGVNPWFVGFVILVLGEMWFFPYQCSYYMQMQAQNRSGEFYSERGFLRFNLFLNLIKVAALFASIPFWQQIGLI